MYLIRKSSKKLQVDSSESFFQAINNLQINFEIFPAKSCGSSTLKIKTKYGANLDISLRLSKLWLLADM